MRTRNYIARISSGHEKLPDVLDLNDVRHLTRFDGTSFVHPPPLPRDNSSRRVARCFLSFLCRCTYSYVRASAGIGISGPRSRHEFDVPIHFRRWVHFLRSRINETIDARRSYYYFFISSRVPDVHGIGNRTRREIGAGFSSTQGENWPGSVIRRPAWFLYVKREEWRRRLAVARPSAFRDSAVLPAGFYSQHTSPLILHGHTA